MARPREFDIDEAIENAMNLFWEKGYQATNLPDLLDAMGIVRGSFYKAFGSKKEVFLRALDLYDQLYVQPGIDILHDESRPGKEAINLVFDAAKQMIKDGDRRGCLLCSSAAETTFHDMEIEAVVNDQLDRLSQAFTMALSRDTTFPNIPSPSEKVEGSRLAQQYVGLRVLQRTGLGNIGLVES